MRLLFGVVLLLAAALPAAAVEVRNCDYAASAQSIAEPWTKYSRTFYGGEVRVAMLDTGGEPVCCSVHLLILAPDNADPLGGRMCRIVGDRDGLGFNGIQFSHLTARYDREHGLLITFPYLLYIDGLRSRSGVARVRVNVQRGVVAIE